MKITVQTPDVATLQENLALFGDRAARYARQAVSTTARDTATAGRRYVKARTGLNFGAKGRGPQRIYWSISRKDVASGGVWVGLAPVPIKYFKPFTPRDMDPETQRAMPGSYAGKQNFFFRGAFVARMPSGHLGIFKRKGRGRLPLDEMKVSSQALNLGGLPEYLKGVAGEKLNAEYTRQMARLWK